MSQKFVRIVSGMYHRHDVSGKVFELVKPFQTSARGGGFVTVKNTGEFPGNTESDSIRVRVAGPMDYQSIEDGSENVNEHQNSPAQETDEEVIARIRERFDILHEMTKAATNGDIRAMIVSGPPGVGKSFGVELEIEKATLLDKIAGRRLRAEVVKGAATPIGLYQTLYKYSDPNCVIVFDDADSIFFDDVSLNLLKGALDTGKRRKISWLSESAALRREGIPDSFDFKGSVIFITNLKFTSVKGKLREHLDALQSRCHFVDLTIDSNRDKLLRIKQLVNDGMLNDYDLDAGAAEQIMEFIEENQSRLRELSLRTVIKAADLRKAFPEKWKLYATTSLLKH